MLTYADERKGDNVYANLCSDQAWQMDVVAMELLSLEMLYKHGGTQFTCFTGTKVQILTLKALQATSCRSLCPTRRMQGATCSQAI
jgi:hypothetical protein